MPPQRPKSYKVLVPALRWSGLRISDALMLHDGQIRKENPHYVIIRDGSIVRDVHIEDVQFSAFSAGQRPPGFGSGRIAARGVGHCGEYRVPAVEREFRRRFGRCPCWSP